MGQKRNRPNFSFIVAKQHSNYTFCYQEKPTDMRWQNEQKKIITLSFGTANIGRILLTAKKKR